PPYCRPAGLLYYHGVQSPASSSPVVMPALIQVACALHVPRQDERTAGRKHDFDGTSPSTRQIGERLRQLERWFTPTGGEGGYSLVTLRHYGAEVGSGEGYSRLKDKSRDGSFSLLVAFGDKAGAAALPEMLRWPGQGPVARPIKRLLPVQRSRDRPEDPGLDDNDFVVCGGASHGPEEEEEEALDRARLFFVYLMAERRAAVFTSHLRERIYTVWLPPAMLDFVRDPDDLGTQAGTIAVFPFLSLVRKPFSQSWRHTFTLSLIVAPTSANASSPRCLDAQEVASIVKSLDGVNICPATGGNVVYRDTLGRLSGYLKALADCNDQQGQLLRLALDDPGASEGSIRQWAEALLVATAARQTQPPRRVVRRREKARELADEVARALRMSALWSVVAGSDDLLPAGYPNAFIRHDAWWPAPAPEASTRDPNAISLGPTAVEDPISVLPPSIAELFDRLPAGNGQWLRPTAAHRLDQVSTGDRTWMSWAPPQRPCVLSFWSLSEEQFPRHSGLSLFGWLGQMVMGAVTAREILGVVGHDLPKRQGQVERAQFGHDLILELEEMFDLDVAVNNYARFYRRLRCLRGLDDLYQKARERASLLGDFQDALAREKATRRSTRISIAAAALALTIIALNVINVTGLGKAQGSSHSYWGIVVASSMAALALLVGSSRWLREWAARLPRSWRRARAWWHWHRERRATNLGLATLDGERQAPTSRLPAPDGSELLDVVTTTGREGDGDRT
ncbi:MAG TPA: hypothetical protein VK425_07080, partial [Acidimicrobiales bacterium]|nr:hypothetical protein [Acidimicrobiales bacterium]